MEFSNYKPASDMQILKDRTNKRSLKVDKTFIQNTKCIELLESLNPIELDKEFYNDLYDSVVQSICLYKQHRQKEMKQTVYNEFPPKVTFADRLAIHALFYPKCEYSVKVYFPCHFQALRKLYCGSFSSLVEQMCRSMFWTDNTGGKSKSQFFKSFNEKFVLKVINSNEMKMFTEFATHYFEYMCRSFHQKCPTAIAKILGAYKIKIRSNQKSGTYYVILMENLTCGIDPNKMSLMKYDLKGSMSRRYVITNGKTGVTRLDTNFIEDQNSKPICMNYVM